MLLHVDLTQATFDYQCEHCGTVHSGLAIDTARGTVIVSAVDVAVVCPTCLDILHKPTICPACHKVHLGITPEHFPFDHLTSVDTGDTRALNSLVGYTFADTHSVVVEDNRGGTVSPLRQQQARLVLQLHGHPHIAHARALAQARDAATTG